MKSKETIKFYLPELSKINSILKWKEWIENYPEYFYDNISIGAIYGAFPYSLWNGGRGNSSNIPPFSREQIQEYYHLAKENNLPIRFTFTNCCLEEKHLFDNYCNMQLELARECDIDLSIIINSELLKNYLEKNYPEFKLILSTTACIRDVNKINDMCEQYSMVIPDYNDNKNAEFLTQLTHPEKIELLINEMCAPNCPYRKRHYYELSKICNIEMSAKTLVGVNCSNSDQNVIQDFYAVLKRNIANNPTVNELYEIYPNLGITNFKIMGRGTDDLYSMESIIYYMVKPQYRDSLRYRFLTFQKELLNKHV